MKTEFLDISTKGKLMFAALGGDKDAASILINEISRLENVIKDSESHLDMLADFRLRTGFRKPEHEKLSKFL